MIRIKKIKNAKSEFIGFKIKLEDKNVLQTRANLFTEGNLSEYILHCALNYQIKKTDLENLEG